MLLEFDYLNYNFLGKYIHKLYALCMYAYRVILRGDFTNLICYHVLQ